MAIAALPSSVNQMPMSPREGSYPFAQAQQGMSTTSNRSTPDHSAETTSIVENPYDTAVVDDMVWEVFTKASEGFDTAAVDAVQYRLFEERPKEGYTLSSAMSLMEWSERAEALKNNILLPQSSATDIPETQKRMIAEQMSTMLRSQTAILDRFSYFAQNGGAISLDLVA